MMESGEWIGRRNEDSSEQMDVGVGAGVGGSGRGRVVTDVIKGT